MSRKMLQLGQFTKAEVTREGDEFVSSLFDEMGEQKVTRDGHLLGGREYRVNAFQLPKRGNRLYMMATDCAKELNYRDSYLLFNKNKSLFKLIATQQEKESLIDAQLLPYSFRSRQIALVTARSMFRQFGSRIIKDGKRVRDDYWEGKAIEQGFTEVDPIILDKKSLLAHQMAQQRQVPQDSSLAVGGDQIHQQSQQQQQQPRSQQQQQVQAQVQAQQGREYSQLQTAAPSSLTSQQQPRPPPPQQINPQQLNLNPQQLLQNQQMTMNLNPQQLTNQPLNSPQFVNVNNLTSQSPPPQPSQTGTISAAANSPSMPMSPAASIVSSVGTPNNSQSNSASRRRKRSRVPGKQSPQQSSLPPPPPQQQQFPSQPPPMPVIPPIHIISPLEALNMQRQTVRQQEPLSIAERTALASAPQILSQLGLPSLSFIPGSGIHGSIDFQEPLPKENNNIAAIAAVVAAAASSAPALGVNAKEESSSLTKVGEMGADVVTSSTSAETNNASDTVSRNHLPTSGPGSRSAGASEVAALLGFGHGHHAPSSSSHKVNISQVLNSQQTVAQFNKYLNNKRKTRNSLWSEFWEHKIENTRDIVKVEEEEYLRLLKEKSEIDNNSNDEDDDDYDDDGGFIRRVRPRRQERPDPFPISLIFKTRKGGLETDRPAPFEMPTPPLILRTEQRLLIEKQLQQLQQSRQEGGPPIPIPPSLVAAQLRMANMPVNYPPHLPPGQQQQPFLPGPHQQSSYASHFGQQAMKGPQHFQPEGQGDPRPSWRGQPAAWNNYS